MYEEIRVKENDRYFTINISTESTLDLEIMSEAFYSALMRYMTDHKELRAEYNEVLKKYSDMVARNPSEYVRELSHQMSSKQEGKTYRQEYEARFGDHAVTPVKPEWVRDYDNDHLVNHTFKEAVAEGAKRMADKIDTDITKSLWADAAKATTSINMDRLKEKLLRGTR